MIADYILTAVEHEHRPDSDRERDQNRKTSEVLDFLKFKQQIKLVKSMQGGGIFLQSWLMPSNKVVWFMLILHQ